MRTIINLAGDQVRRLAAVCRRKGVSRAEAVRRETTDHSDARRLREREDAFDLWRDRQIDGLEYERRQRSEWPESRPCSTGIADRF